MTRFRTRKRIRSQPPPLVPQSIGVWLLAFGKLLAASFILLGCMLAYAISRQAQLLVGATDRH